MMYFPNGDPIETLLPYAAEVHKSDVVNAVATSFEAASTSMRRKFVKPDGRANGIVSAVAEQSPRASMQLRLLVWVTRSLAKKKTRLILSFPEVATSGLALSRWVPRFWGAWQYDQKIQVLEGPCTGDVTPVCCAQSTRPGRSATLDHQQSVSQSMFRSMSEQEF